MQIALIVMEVITSIALILVVLFQSGKEDGLSGAIAGGADTYYSKGKKHSRDTILSRLTVVASIVFCLLVVAMYVVFPLFY